MKNAKTFVPYITLLSPKQLYGVTPNVVDHFFFNPFMERGLFVKKDQRNEICVITHSPFIGARLTVLYSVELFQITNQMSSPKVSCLGL